MPASRTISAIFLSLPCGSGLQPGQPYGLMKMTAREPCSTADCVQGTCGLRAAGSWLYQQPRPGPHLAHRQDTRDLFCCLGGKKRSLGYAAPWAASLGMTE